MRARPLLRCSLCLLVGWYLAIINPTLRLVSPLQDWPKDPVGRALQTFATPPNNTHSGVASAGSKDGSSKGPHLLSFDGGHAHDLPPECTRDATPILFKQWRESKETVCAHGEMIVERYTMKRWESQPSFTVYKNVPIKRLYSQEPVDCEELKILYDAHTSGAKTPTTTIKHPVIRVTAFDPFNSYERFHAHLNVAMAISMFGITDPQILDLITEKLIAEDQGVPQHDMEMYSAISSVKPLIVAQGRDKNSENVTFVPYMVDMFKPGTSILVTKTGGAFRGRGADHHCKSSIFQGIAQWMKTNLLGDEVNETFDGSSETNNKIQVVWSSRAPYCCRPRGVVRTPKRPISDEAELVRRVRKALGNKYNITVANFGNMNTRDSVAIASRSHILVGVHGAGLVWSSFLPPHSGTVELFGGNRGSGNRHYHNIASLADLHYRSLNLRGTTSSLEWNNATVEQIARKIESINVWQEPGPSEAKVGV